MNFTVRLFRPEDAEALCELHIRTIRETCGKVYPPEAIEVWAAPRPAEKYIQKSHEQTFFVAVTAQGQVIGFVSWKETELSGLYVDADFHGQGIGKALLQAAEADALAQGVKLNHLKSTLNAQAFYEKHGYRKVKDSLWEKGGIKIAEVIMEKPA